jgi:uncharacterized protein YecE (DUF72 family)
MQAGSLAEDCERIRRSFAPILQSGILGAVLLQFPWSFHNNDANVGYLDLLFRTLPDFPLAVEVRHGSWDREPFYQFLREKRVSFCNVDQPVIGDSLQAGARVTSAIGYYRLHGRNYSSWFDEKAGRNARYDYLYTKEEVHDLAGKVALVSQTAEETYAITNNHFRGQALVTAMEILEELDAASPAVPPLLAESYPRLKHLSTAETAKTTSSRPD